MPQHELLACAQCGCFAFSCFEDFAIRVYMGEQKRRRHPHNQYLKGVPLEDYDIVLADPLHSVEDAEHYKTSMVQRNKVMRALAAGVKPGTHVVWLDQVFAMYRKAEWDVIGMIGVVRSTNHRFRMVTIFERRLEVPVG